MAGSLLQSLMDRLRGMPRLARKDTRQGAQKGSPRDNNDISNWNASGFSLLDHLDMPIVLIGPGQRILCVNRSASRVFPGFRINFPFSAGIRAPHVLETLERATRSGSRETVELIERVPVDRSFTIRIEPLGKPDGDLLLAFEETTQARRIDATRADFVANASHELRTPLSAILGFIETLRGPARNDAAARAEFLDIMHQQATRMSRLIDDLLSLSALEMDAAPASHERVDLNVHLAGLVGSLSGLAAQRGVRLDFSHPENPLMVAARADDLSRLFENLIENGMKYGQSGGRVDIRLEENAVQKQVRAKIRDFGPGIDKRHLPRLTERFYRADVQESRVLGGTGLGLAIVKHIVQRYGGKLEIDSEPGKGACFTVILPQNN